MSSQRDNVSSPSKEQRKLQQEIVSYTPQSKSIKKYTTEEGTWQQEVQHEQKVSRIHKYDGGFIEVREESNSRKKILRFSSPDRKRESDLVRDIDPENSENLDVSNIVSFPSQIIQQNCSHALQAQNDSKQLQLESNQKDNDLQLEGKKQQEQNEQIKQRRLIASIQRQNQNYSIQPSTIYERSNESQQQSEIKSEARQQQKIQQILQPPKQSWDWNEKEEKSSRQVELAVGHFDQGANHNLNQDYVDQSQTRLTDFWHQKNQNESKKEKVQKEQQKTNQEYKVVIIPAKENSGSKGYKSPFVKNNDIYGIQDTDHEKVQVQQLIEKKKSQQKGGHLPELQQVDLDNASVEPPAQEGQQQHLSQTTAPSLNNYQNQNNIDSNFINSQRNPPEMIVIRSQRGTNPSTAASDSVQQRQLRNNEGRVSAFQFANENQLNIHISEDGTVIHTDNSIRQPLSAENKMARVIMQNEEHDNKQQNLGQVAKQTSLKSQQNQQKRQHIFISPKQKTITIHYRHEEELKTILDHLDMKQKPEKQEKNQQNLSKLQQKVQQPNNIQKPIKQLSQNNQQNQNTPIYEVSKVLFDRQKKSQPKRMIQLPKSLEKKQSTRKTPSNKRKKQTKHKNYTKKTINPAKNVKFSKEKSVNQGASSSDKYQSLMGSTFHYQLQTSVNSKKKSKRKTVLVQVRRSARIFSKSKGRLRQEQIQQSQSEQDKHEKKQQAVRNEQSISGSKKTQQQKRSKTKQLRKSQKYTPRRQSMRLGKSLGRQTIQEPQIDIDWLREHLNEIEVMNACSEMDFREMTQNDKQITQLLRRLNQQESSDSGEQSNLTGQEKNVNRTDRNGQIRMYNKLVSAQSQSVDSDLKVQASEKKQEISQTHNSELHEPETNIEVSYQKQNNQNQQLNESKRDKITSNSQNASFNSQKLIQNKKKIFKQNIQKYKIQEEIPLTISQVIDPDINNRGIYALVRLSRVSQFQTGSRYAVTPITQLKFAKKKYVLQVLTRSKQLVPSQYADSIGYIALNSQLKNLIEKSKEQKRNFPQQVQI